MDIEKEIRNILKGNVELEIPVDEIAVDASLLELGVDSISMIKIILNIENVFDLIFEDDDLVVENFMNIERLVNYVRKRI